MKPIKINLNNKVIKEKTQRQLTKEWKEERAKVKCKNCNNNINGIWFIDYCPKCWDLHTMPNRWWNSNKLKEQAKKLMEAYDNKLISENLFVEKRDVLLKRQKKTSREYKIALKRKRDTRLNKQTITPRKYKNELKEYVKSI